MQLTPYFQYLVPVFTFATMAGCSPLTSGGLDLDQLPDTFHDWGSTTGMEDELEEDESSSDASADEQDCGQGDASTPSEAGDGGGSSTASGTSGGEEDGGSETTNSTTDTGGGDVGGDGGDTDELPEIQPVQIELKTVSPGGKYSPKNVGAVWIETDDGDYVRTLEVWAKTRKRHVVKWNVASGGDVSDAKTSATLKSHVVHELVWDGTDSSGTLVQAGAYVLRAEVTDKNGAGPDLGVPFAMGQGEFSLTPGDSSNFVGISLTSPAGAPRGVGPR